MQINKTPIYIVGELSFALCPAWIPGRTFDVVLWETEKSPQHNHIVSVSVPHDEALRYARGLAEDMQFFLLTQIRDQRQRALAAYNSVDA